MALSHVRKRSLIFLSLRVGKQDATGEIVGLERCGVRTCENFHIVDKDDLIQEHGRRVSALGETLAVTNLPGTIQLGHAELLSSCSQDRPAFS